MSTCKRFETEGIEVLQRGESLSAHYSECPYCIESQQKYHALVSLIKESTQSEGPTEGWQDVVLASESAHSTSSMSKSWPVAIAASITAIAIAVGIGISFLSPTENKFEVAVTSGAESYRGNTAKVGDQISITSTASNNSMQALRIYRDQRLVYSCGLEQVCPVENRLATATVQVHYEIKALGEFQVIMMDGPSSLTTKLSFEAKKLDQDVLIAREAGVEVFLAKPINVH